MTHSDNIIALRSKETVALLGGGVISDKDLHLLQAFSGDIYCVDAGYNTAMRHKLHVAGVIGDMDSLDISQVNVPTFILEDQDFGDFDKSLQIVSAPSILCFGFLGGRMDHSLAAFNAIAKSKSAAFLIGEQDVCVLCPKHLKLDMPKGARFSVYPMVRSTARSFGLEYTLNDIEFDPTGRIGTSNTALGGQITIDIKSGCMLVIFEIDHLDHVLDQWP